MNAFATFYSTTKARVLRAVFMATSGRQRSEDAVSEAFVKAYQHWSRLRQHPNPGRVGGPHGAQRASLTWRIRRRERLGVREQDAASTIETFDNDRWEALKRHSRDSAKRSPSACSST